MAFRAASGIAKVQLSSDKRVIKLITARGSRIRGETFKWVRAKVESIYHFNGDGSKQAARSNKNLYRTLSARNFSAFAYKNRNTWIGYAEHSSIITLLHYIFENGMGAVFEGYFKIVSLKTLASLFTMASGNKWATGEHIKLKKFSEEDHRRYYEAYLEDLTKWDGMNPVASLNIRKRMFEKARDRVCGKSPDEAASHISGDIEDELRAQMAARTGLTESEATDSGDESDNGSGGAGEH
ncbi:hypothetical protein BDP27DRAFT_1429116 [Rhodocollybia butyracea]|uniref:DUF6532 domain-containing protein n=1 Tax=Rhodocollybia butyracea TaxID=206335 RepID=A0A9P5PD89_9AGAR|nr:hypothetical protein BDP27DRAFT_1429116 [Rhodocollybia butyracea]